MEDGSISNLDYTKLSQTSDVYNLERKSFEIKGFCYKYATIIVSLILLMILIPLYILNHREIVFYSTNTHDVPKHWIDRAIYYNSYKVDSKSQFSQMANSNFKLVCYYFLSSAESPDALHPSELDPYLCTHINIGFVAITNCSIAISKSQSDSINAVVALKQVNPKLKVLLSIGGAGNTNGFPEMVLNHTNRKMFIRSIDNVIRLYKLDGIDLDWEFPNKVPSKDSKQKMHFTQLLSEIRNEINRQDKFRFILSVAVAAPRFIIDLSYDVSYMNSYVDYVNVMTYDYHFYTEFTPFTGLNAPLYADINQTTYLASLNINYTVNYWNESGMEKEKIIVGLPTYGHSFELYNIRNNGLMAPARGYGHLGEFGFVNYPDVCKFLTLARINLQFDYSARSPFASKDAEWISFDDETSLMFKADYVRQYKYGGAMILALNSDDYRGRCGNGKFPLTNRVKAVLNEI